MGLWLAMVAPVWGAPADLQGLLASETRVAHNEATWQKVAGSLEEWLSGRRDLAAMKADLVTAQKAIGSRPVVAGEVGRRVYQAERAMLAAVQGFVFQKEPSATSQRALFRTLNDLSRERALGLLDWRSEQARLHSRSAGPSAAPYWAWELAWLPRWRQEVELTHRLQSSALAEGGASSGQGIVGDLLRLQSEASASTPAAPLAPLQETALQRLTVLARTAEQLERLSRSESRGALTRIRRLSRELAQLNGRLQEQRRAFLAALGGAATKQL